MCAGLQEVLLSKDRQSGVIILRLNVLRFRIYTTERMVILFVCYQKTS